MHCHDDWLLSSLPNWSTGCTGSASGCWWISARLSLSCHLWHNLACRLTSGSRWDTTRLWLHLWHNLACGLTPGRRWVTTRLWHNLRHNLRDSLACGRTSRCPRIRSTGLSWWHNLRHNLARGRTSGRWWSSRAWSELRDLRWRYGHRHLHWLITTGSLRHGGTRVRHRLLHGLHCKCGILIASRSHGIGHAAGIRNER